MSIPLDRILKNKAVNITGVETLSTINTMIAMHQDRTNYVLKLLRMNGANAPSFNLNPNANGPVIRPPSDSTSPSRFFLSFGPAPIGKTLRYEIYQSGNISAAPDVTASSPIWDYTSVALGFSYSGGPVIVKAKYFIGSSPASAQSFATYRLPLDLVALQIIRDFAAASSATFSKDIAAILTTWLSPSFQGDWSAKDRSALAQKRTNFINAFTKRSQNTIALLRGLSPASSWSYTTPPISSSPPQQVSSDA